MTHDEFIAEIPERQRSPEWDFGVMWRGDDGRDWPHYRVSWIVETGELYAVRLDGTAEVELLGVVAKVGDYPYGGIGQGNAWSDFNKAQIVEQVMAGWADGDPHKPLSWVRRRIATPRVDGGWSLTPPGSGA